MRIWLITIGEPLPLNGNERLLRTGIFANHLCRNGHDVTWWTSSFDHVRKQHVVSESVNRRITDKFTLFLLRGCGYKKNVSLARLYDHYLLGKKFFKKAEKEKKPDIILCSFPAIELSAEAVKFGKKYGVPVLLDVRDLWPDIFLDVFPSYFKFIGKIILWPLLHLTEVAFRDATAITGVTKPFVEWGVKNAHRDERASDQDFPMGYPTIKISYADRQNAISFWKHKGVAKDRFLVVFFGYFGRQFELKMVIEAAKDLSNLPIDFILCGSGDNYAYYENLAENVSNVILPGWVGRSEISTLMQMANVGLMPYVVKDNFTKNIPNKFIEYLSAGLPILSTLHGEVGSLLSQEKCGLVYKNKNELISSVKQLVKDKQLVQQMALASKKLFNKQFEASLVYSSFESHLVDIICTFKKEN